MHTSGSQLTVLKWAGAGFLYLGFGCTIVHFYLMLDPSGSIVAASFWLHLLPLIWIFIGIAGFFACNQLAVAQCYRLGEEQREKTFREGFELSEKIATESTIAKGWDGKVIVITESLEPGPFGGHFHIKLDEDGADDRIFQFWPDAPIEQFRHTLVGDRFRLKFVKRSTQPLRGKLDELTVGSDLFLYFLDFERV